MSREYINATHFKSVSNVGNCKESFTKNLLVVLFTGTGKSTVQVHQDQH